MDPFADLEDVFQENTENTENLENINTDENLEENDFGQITDEMLEPDNYDFSDDFEDEFNQENFDDDQKKLDDNPEKKEDIVNDDFLNLLEKKDDALSEDKNELDLDIEKMNKAMGTDFKSIEEMKSALKKDTEVDENKEQILEYNKAKSIITNLSDYLQMNDLDLTRQNLIALAYQKGENIKSAEFLESLDIKIQAMEDNELIEDYASQTRASVRESIQKNQNKIDSFDKKQEEKINDEKKKNTDELISAFSEIYKKKTFYGLEVQQEKIREVFSKIRNREFFDDINKSQEKIAKLAMMYYLSDEIDKKASAPTQSDGIQKFSDELGLFKKSGKNRSVANVQSSGSQASIKDLASALKS